MLRSACSGAQAERLAERNREQNATLLRRPCAPAPTRPFVRLERIGRFAALAPQAVSMAPAGGVAAGGLVRTLRPAHFKGRNPYSRHKRSVPAPPSGPTGIS